MPVTQMLTDSAYVLVLVFGGFQVLNGQMEVGFLIGFLLYIQTAVDPNPADCDHVYEIQRAMASAVRIFELIDVAPEIKDSPQARDLPPPQGRRSSSES